MVAFGQQDDFDDGDDLGWLRVDTLGDLGAGDVTTFQITDGEYRIKGSESPAPAEAGPSRGGAFRAERIYEQNFFLSVDLVRFDDSLRQAIGLLSFVQPDPSIGTTSGYSLNYQPAEKDLIINLIEDEVPVRLGLTSLSEDPGEEPLRLVFEGRNGVLKGRIYLLSDLTQPLATVEVFDQTLSSGIMGLFVYSDEDDSTGGTDATFDNYVANAFANPFLNVKAEGEQIQVRWPNWAIDFSLEESVSLKSTEWVPVAPSGIARRESDFVLEDEASNNPYRFFRLKRN